jgi:hypothetical protein
MDSHGLVNVHKELNIQGLPAFFVNEHSFWQFMDMPQNQRQSFLKNTEILKSTWIFVASVAWNSMKMRTIY